MLCVEHDLADEHYRPTTDKVNPRGDSVPDGVAQIYWKRMYPDEAPWKDKTVYSYDLQLTLQNQTSEDTYPVQAGLAFVDLRTKPHVARWSTKEFFIAPGLWGSGIGGKFLNKLLDELALPSCEVMIEQKKRTDPASLQERNDLIAFYKRAGFRLENGKLVWKRPPSAPIGEAGLDL